MSIRAQIETARRRVSESFDAGASGLQLNHIFSDSIDELVIRLFEKSGSADDVALAALGGYGRREMSPYSDIDFVLLYCEDSMMDVKSIMDRIMYPLWDAGLEVTGVARTLKECLKIGKEDIRSLTSMMDARFIAGSEELFGELAAGMERHFSKRINRTRYIKKKYSEYLARLTRYGDSVFVAEPHIKEGEGGLRCYQSALWIARARFGVKGIEQFERLEFFSREKLDEFSTALDFMWRLRCGIHLISGRKQDRLGFDIQEAMARRMSYDVGDIRGSIEAFMRDYYRHASVIHSLVETVIDAAKIGGRLLRLKKRLFFRRIDPSGNNPVGRFREMIKKPAGVDQLIAEMHSNGVLFNIIPEFEKLAHQVQYDAYHYYTVDMHTILVVREISKIAAGGYAKLFPDVNRAYKTLSRPDILVLAGLLHDIGKGCEGAEPHDYKGAKVACDVVLRLGYPDEDASLVEFLVRSHLILSRLAFRRDIDDPKLIENLADAVKTTDNLTFLYLLTFADIRATSPELWSEWKGELLRGLYFKAMRFLTGEGCTAENIEARMREKQEKIANLITKEEYPEFVIWLHCMPMRYKINTAPEAMAAHFENVRLLSFNVVKMDVKLSEDGNYHEVTIVTKDNPGLFAKICAIFSLNRLSILEAQLNTSLNGDVVDIFRVVNPSGRPVRREFDWKKVETELVRVIGNGEAGWSEIEKAESFLRAKPSRGMLKQARGALETEVVIDNDVSADYTVVEVHAPDRIGLLYKIAHWFYKSGYDISMARVLTTAGHAIDIFYITNTRGKKIGQKEEGEWIMRGLKDCLTEGA